jgi:hypothetical protein
MYEKPIDGLIADCHGCDMQIRVDIVHVPSGMPVSSILLAQAGIPKLTTAPLPASLKMVTRSVQFRISGAPPESRALRPACLSRTEFDRSASKRSHRDNPNCHRA